MAKQIATDDIWDFVERKLNTQVPAYFKTVLKICGYNNGISISAIQEEDMEYIKGEVRSGNVAKAFHGSKVDFLEECTRKAEDFEFVLGHKRFLWAIVDFLKKHLAENGPDSFSLNEKPSKKTVSKNIQEKKLVPQSRKKVAKKNDKSYQLVQHAIKTELELQRKASKVSQAVLAEHRRVLLEKTINAMASLTPNLLEKDIETIKKKISGDFITFELDEDCEDTIAFIKCVFCPKPLTAYLRPTPKNEYLWKSSNFNRHLRIIHRFEDSNSQESDDQSDVESKAHDERKEKSSDSRKDEDLVSKGDIEQIENPIDLENEKYLDKEGDLQLECHDQQTETFVVMDKKDTKSYGHLTQTPNDLENQLPSGSNIHLNGTSSIVQKAQKLINKIPEPVSRSSTKTESDLELAKNALRESPNCIPILKNGCKTRHGNDFIITTHTCAFDAINSFTSIYLESSHVRDQYDNNGSKISELIKSIFNRVGTTTSQASSSTDFKEIYAARNIILRELYVGWCLCKGENVKKQHDTTFIDCFTGIGALFARICMKLDNNLISGIEEKICKKCETKHTKLLPFMKTTETIRHFAKINDYLDRSSAERLCITCKNKCKITTSWNNIVLLETEPPAINRSQKIALENVAPVLHINNTQYLLCAVMHFNVKLKHFVSYIRQKDRSWKCLDDLKKNEQKPDPSTETSPFIVCYVAATRCIDFEKAIQDRKSVLDPAMNPSNNHSQTMLVPQDLGKETSTKLAAPASQIDLQTDPTKLVTKKRKKRNKNRNSNKRKKS